jgi:hypothetical protein
MLYTKMLFIMAGNVIVSENLFFYIRQWEKLYGVVIIVRGHGMTADVAMKWVLNI